MPDGRVRVVLPDEVLVFLLPDPVFRLPEVVLVPPFVDVSVLPDPLLPDPALLFRLPWPVLPLVEDTVLLVLRLGGCTGFHEPLSHFDHPSSVCL